MKKYLSKNYPFFKQVLLVIVFVLPFGCKKENPVTPPPVGDSKLVAYQCEDGKFGFKDKETGEQVIECKYNNAMDFCDGLAAVAINMKWGFIDTKGNEVIPLKYQRTYSFSENLAAVQLDNKWGFMDKKGNIVIPFEYEKFYFDLPQKVFGFSEGLVGVRKVSSKWGFIDTKGNVALPFIYDNLRGPFKNGEAKVTLDGMNRCVTKTGELTPC